VTDALPHHFFSDDQNPHDPQRSRAQIAGLLQLLAPPPKRILDLGCGEGRILFPLLEADHDVTGLDHDAEMLQKCRTAAEVKRLSATLQETDFLTATLLGSPQSFDAVCLLGNTIMTVVDVDDAANLFCRICEVLRPGGQFFIDDCPHDLWPELTEGHWQSGLSEDGSLQMVWDKADAIFALRAGDQVDPASWEFKPTDQPRRMWTMGDLRLIARLAGLSAPQHHPDAAVLVMQRPAT